MADPMFMWVGRGLDWFPKNILKHEPGNGERNSDGEVTACHDVGLPALDCRYFFNLPSSSAGSINRLDDREVSARDNFNSSARINSQPGASLNGKQIQTTYR
jgi:hypothetical protein